jgi:hypothetical protein
MLRRLAQRLGAFLERAGQATFERLQFFDFAANHGQLLGDQVPDMDAGLLRVTLNGEKLADFVKGKSELLRLLDEFQIGDFVLVIEPISASAPDRAR